MVAGQIKPLCLWLFPCLVLVWSGVGHEFRPGADSQSILVSRLLCHAVGEGVRVVCIGWLRGWGNLTSTRVAIALHFDKFVCLVLYVLLCVLRATGARLRHSSVVGVL